MSVTPWKVATAITASLAVMFALAAWRNAKELEAVKPATEPNEVWVPAPKLADPLPGIPLPVEDYVPPAADLTVVATGDQRCQRGVLMKRVRNGWRAATYDDGTMIPCTEKQVCRGSGGELRECPSFQSQ